MIFPNKFYNELLTDFEVMAFCEEVQRTDKPYMKHYFFLLPPRKMTIQEMRDELQIITFDPTGESIYRAGENWYYWL